MRGTDEIDGGEKRRGRFGCRDRAMTIKRIFGVNPSPENIKQFTEWGYELG